MSTCDSPRVGPTPSATPAPEHAPGGARTEKNSGARSECYSHHVRRHLDRLHAGTFTGPTGMFRQRTELSKPQQDLLARLDIPAPTQIIELAPASR